jgi:hypothetical protein
MAIFKNLCTTGHNLPNSINTCQRNKAFYAGINPLRSG